MIWSELYIGGAWTAPSTTDVIDVRSPHDGSPVGRVPLAGPADVHGAVAAAPAAFDIGPWPRLTPEFSELGQAVGALALLQQAIENAKNYPWEIRRGPSYGYAADVGVPFGGYKASGIGREYGPEGFEHYVELKSVYGAPQ